MSTEDQETQDQEQVQDQQPQSETDTGAQSQSQADTAQGAGLVIESRDWYRDKFRRVTMICLILVLILAGSLVANSVQVMSRPSPRYFAVTDDLRIEKLQPLNKPMVSQSGLFTWTTRKVTETLSMDFVHYRKQLMDVKPAYTEKAFEQLVGSLKSSGNLQMLKKKKLVMSSTVQRSPVVKAKGEVSGRMTWKLEFPIDVTYESSERVVSSQQLMCNVMVRRVPVTNHPRGINIEQIVLR